MRILLDTGPLVAAVHNRDKFHDSCVRLFQAVRGPLLLPTSVLIEASWLINKRVGSIAQARFLESIGTDVETGAYELIHLLPRDLRRMSELAIKYQDLRLDPTDASVIALAERLDVATIATLDRRDFTVVRPQHVAALTLVP